MIIKMTPESWRKRTHKFLERFLLLKESVLNINLTKFEDANQLPKVSLVCRVVRQTIWIDNEMID